MPLPFCGPTSQCAPVVSTSAPGSQSVAKESHSVITADERCLIPTGVLTTAHLFSCLLHQPLSLSCHPSLPTLHAVPSLILRPSDRMDRRVCITGLKAFPRDSSKGAENKCWQRKGQLQVQNLQLCVYPGLCIPNRTPESILLIRSPSYVIILRLPE